MRKYLREIARQRMKRAGIQQMNKKRGADKKGYFSQYWREAVADLSVAPKKQRRHARAREART